MLQSMKQKLDLWFDSGISILNQAVNSPKTGGVVSPALIGFGINDINNALETASITVGLIIGGLTLWGIISNKTHERRKRKEEDAIRAMEYKNLQLKNNALVKHIKKK